MQDQPTYNIVLLEYEPCQYRINFCSEIVKVEVLAAVILKITVFWDRMLCTLKMEDGSSRFIGKVYIYLPGISAASIFRVHSILWRHVPEDSHFRFEFFFSIFLGD